MQPLKPLVQSAIANDLKEFVPRHGGGYCSLWEYRSLNMHRGVILVERPGEITAEAIVKEIHTKVGSEFNLAWAWLRGFAFGAVVSTSGIPENLDRLVNCIDRYDRSAGVFQWLVHISDTPPMAFGIHMWAEGYLTPTFRRIVQSLRKLELECPTFVDDKGPFFEFVKVIGKLKTAEFRSDE
jgi:hypothetical protein